MRLLLLLPLASLLGALPVAALEVDFNGNLIIEQRHFPEQGKHPSHEQDFASVSSELDIGFFSASGRHALIIKPFGRYDQYDENRSHTDLREAKYRFVDGNWEVTLGIDKVFWGVTEFLHLVDIANQSDNLESVDGEQKLGQPMARVDYASSYGTVSIFALPYFRPQQFHDAETGRPNYGFVVDNETAVYENDAGLDEMHAGEGRAVEDYALRYAHSFGVIDFGLSWFDGTSRTPEILHEPVGMLNGQPILRAKYNLLQQAGLDVQATLGAWLLKLEATHSEKKDEEFTRATGGFEYSFYGLFGSSSDLGLVVEYLWDERRAAAPHPFGDDLGIGLRWTANDTQSTAILLGGLIDTETDSTAISLEAERRIGQNVKLIIEARFQDKVGEGDRFAITNKGEGFARVQLGWYF